MLKQRIIRYILLCVLLISISGGTSYGTVLTHDSVLVVVRMPDKEFVQTYLNDKDFNYQVSRSVNENMFWPSLWERIRNFLYKTTNIYKAFPILIKLGFFGLLIFLIYIAVTKTRIYSLFYTEQSIKLGDVSEIDEEYEEIEDFDSAIQAEIAKKQYRRAIRLHYLKILGILDSIALIKLSKEKTNREYVLELKEHLLLDDFKKLTSEYNLIWYGQIEINKEQYISIAEGFNHFNSGLNEEA